MSYEYAMARAQDALDKSGGNHLKAQRLMIDWIKKDHTLLFGLVGQHLPAIIAAALRHVDAPPVIAKKAKPAAKTRRKGDDEVGEFGEALIDSLTSGRNGSVQFGEQTPKNISRPGKASKAHVDAIRAIAEATRAKGKGKK